MDGGIPSRAPYVGRIALASIQVQRLSGGPRTIKGVGIKVLACHLDRG